MFVVQYEMKRHMCDKDMFYVGMKRTNACSYALTWVNVGFNMKVSVAVFLTGAIIALDETLEHIHESNAS